MAEHNAKDSLAADVAAANSRLDSAKKDGKDVPVDDLIFVMGASRLKEDSPTLAADREAMEARNREAKERVNGLVERENERVANAGHKDDATAKDHAAAHPTKVASAKSSKKPHLAAHADKHLEEIRASLQGDIAKREEQAKIDGGSTRNSEIIAFERDLVKKDSLSVEDIKSAFQKSGHAQQAATVSSEDHPKAPIALPAGERVAKQGQEL